MAFFPPQGPLGPFGPLGPLGPQGLGPMGPGPMGPMGPGQMGPGPLGPGGTQQFQPPSSPPPAFTPQQPATSLFAIDPGAISGCLFRNTFLWLNNGQSFWFFPVFVGRTSTSGFRWNGRFWMFSGVDLRQINSFTCY